MRQPDHPLLEVQESKMYTKDAFDDTVANIAQIIAVCQAVF